MNEENDQRNIARDSLFVLADVRINGSTDLHKIKVRNLSSGGMMGEGAVKVIRGDAIAVDIRNIGWVEGSVAWVQDSRFGVAFMEEIDPKVARAPVSDGTHTPRFVKPPVAGPSGGIVRKV